MRPFIGSNHSFDSNGTALSVASRVPSATADSWASAIHAVDYVGWSGVAYASHSRERGLTIDELVTCELTVQVLWCFIRQIQQMIEDGQDPAMPEQYGWRFPRAAYSRLTMARAQETAQHVQGAQGRTRMTVLPLRRSVGLSAGTASSRVATVPMCVRRRPSRTRSTISTS